MKNVLHWKGKQFFQNFRKITLLSFLAFPLFAVLFVFTSAAFGYGVAEENQFHFPSFFLNMLFAAVMLFNMFCAVVSPLMCFWQIRCEKQSPWQVIKSLFFGFYPILLIGWFWNFDISQLTAYFKIPFEVIESQWKWILNGM